MRTTRLLILLVRYILTYSNNLTIA
uniref:Uncharacterized protein n=1 Tax=Arundo donax TaxID=35708 RepID=A0A0A9FVB5_ARUDO